MMGVDLSFCDGIHTGKPQRERVIINLSSQTI